MTIPRVTEAFKGNGLINTTGHTPSYSLLPVDHSESSFSTQMSILISGVTHNIFGIEKRTRKMKHFLMPQARDLKRS
mgnify:FL=1